jgi:hypothetical protein
MHLVASKPNCDGKISSTFPLIDVSASPAPDIILNIRGVGANPMGCSERFSEHFSKIGLHGCTYSSIPYPTMEADF